MGTRNASRVSVFVGTSLDGFIARQDGDFKWLEQASDSNLDYGFNDFFAHVDALVMGRNTFDVMARLPTWYYGDKPVIVLTHRAITHQNMPKTVETMAGEPQDIVGRLAERGFHRLYVDGGQTIQAFLRADLVDDLTVSRLPILIGTGIPLFGSLRKDIHLKHIGTRTFPGGMIQSSYEVVNERRGARMGVGRAARDRPATPNGRAST